MDSEDEERLRRIEKQLETIGRRLEGIRAPTWQAHTSFAIVLISFAVLILTGSIAAVGRIHIAYPLVAWAVVAALFWLAGWSLAKGTTVFLHRGPSALRRSANIRCVDCGYFSYVGGHPDYGPSPPFPGTLNQQQREEVQRREFKLSEGLVCSKELKGFSKETVFDEALRGQDDPCHGYYPYHLGATTALHFQYEAQQRPLKWARISVAISAITFLAVLGFSLWQLVW